MQEGSTKQTPNQTGSKGPKTGTKSATRSAADNEALCDASGGGDSSPGVPGTSGNYDNGSQASASSSKRKTGEEKASGSQKKSKISKTPVPTASGTPSGANEGSTGSQTKGKDEDVSNMISKCHHAPQPPAMRASLLEKVLNEKKLALMRSPEVIAWLQNHQKVVEEEHQQAPASLPRERVPKNARSVEAVKGSSSTEYRSSRGLLETERADSSTSSSTTTQGQSGDDESDGGETRKLIPHSIWSREASAFTSVTRTTNSQK